MEEGFRQDSSRYRKDWMTSDEGRGRRRTKLMLQSTPHTPNPAPNAQELMGLPQTLPETKYRVVRLSSTLKARRLI